MDQAPVMSHLTGSWLQVKSKYLGEFRRFHVKRDHDKFQDLYHRIESLHQINHLEFIITYTDPIHGDLLPINNDENFAKAKQTSVNLLRIYVHDRETFNQSNGFGQSTVRKKKRKKEKQLPPQIGFPEDFRPVSAIIDVDILPGTLRRVRLHKHGSDKPLGFYIRDGVSLNMTTNGLEKVPGIFISRLVQGGLAEMTGLLAVNDEVLEVNSIEVTGKTLDQVTDMMVANSSNLIITVKPASMRNTVTSIKAPSKGHIHDDLARNTQEESDEEQDIVKDIPAGPAARKPDESLKPVEQQNKKGPKEQPSTNQTSVIQSSPAGTKDFSPIGNRRANTDTNLHSPNQSPRSRPAEQQNKKGPKEQPYTNQTSTIQSSPTGSKDSSPIGNRRANTDTNLHSPNQSPRSRRKPRSRPAEQQNKKGPKEQPSTNQRSTIQSSPTGSKDSSPIGSRRANTDTNLHSPNQSRRSRRKRGRDSVRAKRKSQINMKDTAV